MPLQFNLKIPKLSLPQHVEGCQTYLACLISVLIFKKLFAHMQLDQRTRSIESREIQFCIPRKAPPIGEMTPPCSGGTTPPPTASGKGAWSSPVAILLVPASPIIALPK